MGGVEGFNSFMMAVGSAACPRDSSLTGKVGKVPVLGRTGHSQGTWSQVPGSLALVSLPPGEL